MRIRHQRRRGSILPLVAVCLVALIAMIALGIDLGVLAVARTEAQNAADLAALAGVRTLQGAVPDNNRPNAEAFAKTAASSNTVLNNAVQTSQVTVTTGVYVYDTTAQQFRPDFSGTQGTNWTAMRVQIATSQPTYFAQMFGLGPVNVGAVATAVHRPRDVAIVLDFSTSMQYSSNTNIRGADWGLPVGGLNPAGSGSQNPDPIYPQFGPWAIYPPTGANPMMATSNYADRGGEGHGLSNLTVANNNGPPIIGDFLYDTSGGAGTSFVNAFVGPSADPGGYVCSNTAQYSATNTPVVTPTPSAWTNHPSTPLDGDLWPLKKPKTYQNTPNPALADWASTVKELLTGTNGAYANNTPASTIANSWDVAGYDFDPNTGLVRPGYVPGVTSTSVFKGYTLGPGYYGKTFYMWPPDPRTPAGTPGQPTYVPGDWRQRYLNTQDNSVLWDNSGNWKGSGATIQYSQVLAWLKSGPQTLPGNLQSGRIVYFTSIPGDVNSGGTNSDTDRDKRFWKEYIDFVLGYGSYPQNVNLYGQAQSNGFGGSTFGAPVKITPRSLLTGNPKPYMNYNDLPIHPRAHFWFGPLSMLAFLTATPEYGRNWLPGTSHEAHCWHLKAGIQSAIQDIKNNHPNDFASLIYFSTLGNYNTPRVPLGQNYRYLTNALWYPYSLIDSSGNVNGTMRPYDGTWNDLSQGDIPNSNGGTNPTAGFMAAYNEFKANGRRGASKVVVYETDGVAHDYYDTVSSYNSGSGLFTFQGATDEAVSYNVTDRSKTEQVKMACVLCNPTTGASAYTFSTPDFSVAVPAIPGLSTTRAPVRMHSIGFGELYEPNLTNQNTQGNPQFLDSLMQQCALKCLLYVQVASGTSPATDTIGSCWGFPGTPTTPGSPGPPVVRGGGGYTSGTQSFKIIVGDYSTRIDILREALQRIMQSGVQLALVE
jgi:Flp pilus assembly protein TadG